jgi:hypothetical protein
LKDENSERFLYPYNSAVQQCFFWDFGQNEVLATWILC